MVGLGQNLKWNGQGADRTNFIAEKIIDIQHQLKIWQIEKEEKIYSYNKWCDIIKIKNKNYWRKIRGF